MPPATSKELPGTTNDQPGMSNPDPHTDVPITEAKRAPARYIERVHTYYIWSIFNLLFIPFGILCCYFSYRVDQFKAQNRYKMANKWSKRTFVLNLMTTLLMICVITISTMIAYNYHQKHLALEGNETLTTRAYVPWKPGH